MFNSIWHRVGGNLGKYRSYPRIVGETGGKDFVVVHASADPQEVAVGLVRGRLRVSGAEVLGGQPRLPAEVALAGHQGADARDDRARSGMGDVRDFRNFMGAVIDDKAFTKISEYLADAKQNATIIAGGTARGDEGYFIEPTIVEAKRPDYRLMCEEIFGPVLTVYRLRRQQVAGDARDRRRDVAVRADRRRVRQRSPRDPRGVDWPCATPPGTSTSTTSRPARSSASSRSAAPARRAPTTRPGRR